MATLVLQEVDERLVQSLQERARRHGRSVEAEHRALLEAALENAAPSTQALLAFFRRGGELGLGEADLTAVGAGGPVQPPRLSGP